MKLFSILPIFVAANDQYYGNKVNDKNRFDLNYSKLFMISQLFEGFPYPKCDGKNFRCPRTSFSRRRHLEIAKIRW